jgi:hypothetical protein
MCGQESTDQVCVCVCVCVCACVCVCVFVCVYVCLLFEIHQHPGKRGGRSVLESEFEASIRAVLSNTHFTIHSTTTTTTTQTTQTTTTPPFLDGDEYNDRVAREIAS